MWWTTDGVTWHEAHPNDPTTGFSPRSSLSCVAFDNKLWVIGGTGIDSITGETIFYDDVWCSTDGDDVE